MDTLDELINGIDEWLASGQYKDAQGYVKYIYSLTFEYLPDLMGILNFYNVHDNSGSYSDDKAIKDIKILYGKLKLFRDTQNREFEIEKLRAAKNGAIVYVSQNTSQSTNASVNNDIDISNTLTEEIKQSNLSENDCKELTELVEQMKSDAKKKDKSGFVDKLTKSLNIAQNSVALISTILTIAEPISHMLIK